VTHPGWTTGELFLTLRRLLTNEACPRMAASTAEQELRMANETENRAIELVMKVERSANREPEDVRLKGRPYDVSSPPRQIEVKAFGGSARSAPIPIEDSQAKAARADPANFYLYVVDNVARRDEGLMRVRVIDGNTLIEMLDATKPHLTYWPTYRAADYDQAEQLGQT